jgi:3',5'-cyclic AMP phosphodiesterase CpdA
MTVLLHVSDTHFGTEQPAVVEAVLRLARAQAPRLVLLSGDITQRARRGQFERARRFVDALGAPCLAVPGNHDIPLFNLPARLSRPHAGYQRCFGNALEPRWQDDAVAVAGVDTTRWWRHKHGEVSAAQVAAVAQWLRAGG